MVNVNSDDKNVEMRRICIYIYRCYLVWTNVLIWVNMTDCREIRNNLISMLTNELWTQTLTISRSQVTEKRCACLPTVIAAEQHTRSNLKQQHKHVMLTSAVFVTTETIMKVSTTNTFYAFIKTLFLKIKKTKQTPMSTSRQQELWRLFTIYINPQFCVCFILTQLDNVVFIQYWIAQKEMH